MAIRIILSGILTLGIVTGAARVGSAQPTPNADGTIVEQTRWVYPTYEELVELRKKTIPGFDEARFKRGLARRPL